MLTLSLCEIHIQKPHVLVVNSRRHSVVLACTLPLGVCVQTLTLAIIHLRFTKVVIGMVSSSPHPPPKGLGTCLSNFYTFMILYPCISKVDHPEKYGFNPKQLLNHLTDIYLHLRGDVLARAIATDERSYRKELFETCMELLRNKNIKSEVCNMHEIRN